ncbi:MAG: hypothetical protein ACREYC_11350, partial [Gammaproteobacteria bacterium]
RDRRLLATGPRPDHQQVVVVHTTALPSITNSPAESRRPPSTSQRRGPGSRQASREVNSGLRQIHLDTMLALADDDVK